MDPLLLSNKLEGVIGFPVTPFLDQPGAPLDREGIQSNLDFMLESPLSAVVAAGGTGELYSLTPEERNEVVQLTIETAKERVPVIAGVGFNRAMAVQQAKDAERMGAAGILAFPPYFPGADFEGLLDYYRAIGEATGLGLLIYTRDWVSLNAEQAKRLADAIPNLIAWKDGQGNIRQYQQIQNALGDRFRWIGGAGDDLVGAYYSMGIRAYTSSIAVIAPQISCELHVLASAERYSELHELMDEAIIPLYRLRSSRKGYEVSAMKWLMNELGLRGGVSRPPIPEVNRPEDIEILRSGLDFWRDQD